jgi:DMSO reductase family type II enzyme chaperone
MVDKLDLHIQCAPIRGSLYRHLAATLSYPSREFYDRWISGELNREVSALLSELPYTLAYSCVDKTQDSELENVTELASEYMRLFELPVDGQPVPLYGGIYASNRREVMEELLRYYHHFGLSTQNSSEEDLPDSILTVLEFLQFLALRESNSKKSQDIAVARSAQKDLLDRHLTRWMPDLAAQLDRRNALPLYRNTLSLLNDFISAELDVFRSQPA